MKLQPNFSWQAYQEIPEDQAKQFQFQLQKEHILVSNAINSTIDDLSFFTKERATSEAWIDGKEIYKKTFQALVSAYPLLHGIVSIGTLIQVIGTAQDTIPLTAQAYPISYAAATVSTNSIGVNVTNTSIVLSTNGGIYDTYTATITLLYTKV